MWENNRKKVIIRNILIFILLAFVVAGLFLSYRRVKARIDAEDRRLTDASNNQRRELSDTRQENLEAVQAEYDVDMQTVAAYLPGVVCWGDSLTAGSSGNVSYPYILQKYLNAYLCDIYDFRSSIEHAENYSRLKWADYKFSVPVINMGAGQEDSATVIGRSGVVPYVTRVDFTIPADTSDVAISFTAADGNPVVPLTAGSVGINPVTIAGVKGTLSMDVQSQAGWRHDYLFTRLEPGEAVHVPVGTEIITAAAGEYTNYIHIVWIGTYDVYRTPLEFVNNVKTLLKRQTGNTDRYLVIGPCTYNGSWLLNSTYGLDAIDSAMLQAFGSHYINLRKYLIEDGLRDAGLSASAEDAANLKKGLIPAVFRSNASGADLNGVAYTLIGKLVFDRMDHLGYFDEVREELNLDKTMQAILKNDPQYFDRILAVN